MTADVKLKARDARRLGSPVLFRSIVPYSPLPLTLASLHHRILPLHQAAAGAGVRPVVSAMSAHVNNAAVQARTPSFPSNWTARGRLVSTRTRRRRPPLRFSALNLPWRPQEAGCAALRNLASKLGPTDKGAAITGIRAVVTAMRAHQSVVGVQEAALGALRNFAVLTEVKEAVDEARQPLRRPALTSCSQSAEETQCRAHLFRSLRTEETGALQSTRSAPSLMASCPLRWLRAQGIEAVVAVLQAHAGNAGVQEQGHLALDNLISAPAARASAPRCSMALRSLRTPLRRRVCLRVARAVRFRSVPPSSPLLLPLPRSEQ